MGEQAIFPGGDPASCTAVEGQTQSNDVWCVNNCDIANWKEQAPECPLNLCQCTKSGDKKKKWDLTPAKEAVVPTAQATAPDVPTWDPSTVPQYEAPEYIPETAADRRGGIASAEDFTNPKIPTAPIPSAAAARPALKKVTLSVTLTLTLTPTLTLTLTPHPHPQPNFNPHPNFDPHPHPHPHPHVNPHPNPLTLTPPPSPSPSLSP